MFGITRRNTECWSQGRAKLRDFPRHCGAENTQPSPSFTPTLGTQYYTLTNGIGVGGGAATSPSTYFRLIDFKILELALLSSTLSQTESLGWAPSGSSTLGYGPITVAWRLALCSVAQDGARGDHDFRS